MTISDQKPSDVLGLKIVANEFYELGSLDYRSQLLKIRSSKPDIIFVASFGHFLGLTLKQARELGIQSRIIAVYESEDPSVISSAMPYADGLECFVSYNPNPSPAQPLARYKIPSSRSSRAPREFLR